MPSYYPTSAVGTGTETWGCWNQQYVTSAATTSTSVIIYAVDCWPAWNGAYQVNYASYSQPTAEVLAEQRRVAVEQQAARESAEQRAEELLFLFLSAEQRQDYKSKGYFETSVNDTRYRIGKGRAGNIHKIDSAGKATVRMCVHPHEWLPDEDNVLAQFLALHSDAGQLERTANHTRLS